MEVVVPPCEGCRNHSVSWQSWKDWSLNIVTNFKAYLHLLVAS
jgi:hypothetical protein